MTQIKFCQECNQKHNCQDIYQQMGKAKGPSVAFKAAIAFLLPILVFIVNLAIFEKFLIKIIKTEPLRIALDFLLALLVTLGFILTNKQFGKNK